MSLVLTPLPLLKQRQTASRAKRVAGGLFYGVSLVVGLFVNVFPSMAHATGFEPLPIDGVLLENGRSAYVLCNTTGKFDPASHYDIPHKPTPSHSNTCAVFPNREIVAPLPDFKLVTHASRQAVMNNDLTGNEDKKIATVMDFVWRNASINECIYGTKILVLSSKDANYNTQLPGKQFFRVSDIARGGFSGQDIEVAYAVYSSGAEPVYRIGRSFTSVQYRKSKGFQRQPLTEPAYHQAINGGNNDSKANQNLAPEPGQQSASLNEQWVNFTTLVGLPKRPASPMLYVKTHCSEDSPAEFANAIRLRQTVHPFIELSIPGFAPAGASLNETPNKTLQP